MPGIAGEVTDFRLKWNADLKQRLYGPSARGKLDGEYIDSSEGYVTAELDFRRDHFAAAATPLTFSSGDCRPAIFRGLVALSTSAHRRDLHGMGKLMMANSTPIRLAWLAPLLEVMGTETDWNRSALVADVRRGPALPPRDVQGQALLLPDEHSASRTFLRAGRKVHAAIAGLRDVSRLF